MIGREGEAYFYGANSERGFVITPDRKAGEREGSRCVIIKGGPGSGKSTMMKRFSREAQIAGWQVTDYYCSSDPDSFDAVTAEKGDDRLFVCDGTAPHIADPVYPGACSEILDLTSEWNREALAERARDIAELTEKKKACFGRAYSYEAASHEVYTEARRLTSGVIDRPKLDSFTERALGKLKLKKGEPRFAFTEAVSMKGAVSLDTLARSADEIYFIDDELGASCEVMDAFRRRLDLLRAEYVACLCPYETGTLDSVFIPSVGRLYTVIETDGAKSLNSARFLQKGASGIRGRLRLCSKCRKALLEAALSSLEEAKSHHFALEDIYIRSLDFRSLDRVCEKRLLSLL